ncbi:adenylyl-sulfate kinase [Pseudomonas sp. CDFA 602]|uniref:adenylyl-sulfate kinase n=1 Tax=Pseudomonas californiensis TaxID=2829823 RepID=UPI001E62958E|nr:adenylyl-sulfate kinase [Pseudomonas californiensis]MCD5992139.1 adenylyl-sulfate kinase [Pseudomonas californiensis]MCD5997747.1 adenylyl-sulfate kinase [Pseudomonas californiensis]
MSNGLLEATPASNNTIFWQGQSVSVQARQKLNGHPPAVLWFTGLSGSGKSTLSAAVSLRLHGLGYHTFVLDGDNLRHGLCSDLGFSSEDRHENIRRVGEVASLFVQAGSIVLTAFISPFIEDRQRARAMVPEGHFFEIYCNADVAACEKRDVKGLYQRARSGEVKDFSGISSPYEAPTEADLVLHTARDSIESCIEAVVELFNRRLKRMVLIGK